MCVDTDGNYIYDYKAVVQVLGYDFFLVRSYNLTNWEKSDVAQLTETIYRALDAGGKLAVLEQIEDLEPLPAHTYQSRFLAKITEELQPTMDEFMWLLYEDIEHKRL